MNTKKHGKSLHHDVFAAYPLVETLMSIGISVTLLSVFFFSTINVYKIYDRPEADLKAKSIDVMEKLVAFPGQDSSDNLGWEDDPGNIGILGLKATPTVAYGIIYVDPNTGEVIPIEGQYTFSDGDIGVIDQCFIAGTRVLMADGSHKNIEHINIGDMVTSYDVQTGEFVAGRVTQVFQDPPEMMLSNYYLVINNNLRVTPDHLMFSNGKWIPAGDLSIGDCLFSRTQNTDYHVYSIERVYERLTTFNLEIEQFHTYFVSIDDDVDVLVHNPLGKTQVITVDKPTTGDKLIFGSSYTITWSANDAGIFNIDLYNGTKLDKPIYAGLNYGAGSHMNPWTVDASKPGSSYIIRITDTKTGVTGSSGSFSIIEYYTLKITINPYTGGYVNQNPGPPYSYGESVTLEAIPNPGYKFDHWEGNLTGNTNPTTITMNSNKAITAKFAELPPVYYRLTINIVGSGTVTPASGGSYLAGTDVSVEATPAPGWQFKVWSGDLSGTDNKTKIMMNSNKSITATFTELPPVYYTLTIIVAPAGAGLTIPLEGSYVCYEGEVVNILAIGLLGHKFDHWSEALTGNVNPITITMNGNKKVIANFVAVPTHTLTMVVDPAGTGSTNPSEGPHPYNEGDRVEINATPKIGYKFDHWEGNLTGNVNPITITMNGNKNVTANFTDDPSYSGIHAEFVWFDADGVGPGRKIFFDASKSVEGKDGKTCYTWWWNWTENKSLKQSGTNLKTVMYTYPDEQPHTVRLQVNDSSNNHSCIYIVQVNTFQKPNIEPWTEHDMETFPENDDQTTATYDKGYYTTYTNLDNNYHLYEIKEKTGSPYTILDYKKINSLNNVSYYTAKSALGLNTSDYAAYNFNISISDHTGVIFSYGASYTPSSVKASTSIIREVLIYYSPEAQENGFGEWTINKHPKYEKAQITVRIFLGGIPPE
ncbi:MAG: polymorphic toxin-type HINT domain-containing protein [Euryarchaeota archaeon]|nr:polymorphic toxin-type HINT domain-containing protein [Euryarchaeota archaeon]